MIETLIFVQLEEEKIEGMKLSGECRTVTLQISQYWNSDARWK